MIYTVTLNPSIDYHITIDDFQLGKTSRTTKERMVPGGKGLNVSQMLHQFGIESTALGFVAGFVGEQIASMFEDTGVKSDFIYIKEGCSRINIKLDSSEGTEINGKGPDIKNEHIELLMDKIRQFKAGDLLVLSGSLPGNLPTVLYKRFGELASRQGVEVICDATGDFLKDTLPCKPLLVKPNKQELEEIFDTHITEPESCFRYAKRLQQMGARNVIVSMGSQGAIALTEKNDRYVIAAPKGEVKSAVGAGDSLVAGFIASYLENGICEDTFKMAVAAGSASAFSEDFASEEQVRSLFASME